MVSGESVGAVCPATGEAMLVIEPVAGFRVKEGVVNSSVPAGEDAVRANAVKALRILEGVVRFMGPTVHE